MTRGEEFRTYMKAADRDHSNQNEPHLNEAGMIAYYRGELPEAEREAAQVHLLSCAECIALFRSLSDFIEPARDDEEDVTAAETNEQWESFVQRVKIAPVIQGDFKRSRNKFFLDSRLTLAMAASLVISLGAIGWLAWSLRQERQSLQQSRETAAELKSKQTELEQRLAQLSQSGEDQIRREREQREAAEAERNRLQELLAAARTSPAEDVRVYPFALSSERGSGDELQLKLNTAAQVRLLISKPGAFARYNIELVDQNGKIVQKFAGVRPAGVDRALSIRLNRGALRPGKYHLRLFGRDGTTTTPLGEYALSVN